jgi:hypothetical protein
MSVFVGKIVSYHRPDGSPSQRLATDGAGSNEKWWTCCTQHKTIDDRSPIPNIESRSFKLYEIQDRGAESEYMGLIESLSVQPYCLITHVLLPCTLQNNYSQDNNETFRRYEQE